MKRVLVFLMGAALIASLCLVVSCQKQEETSKSGETSSYSEQGMAPAEKAMKETAEKAGGYGEKAMKEGAEKAGGYGQ